MMFDGEKYIDPFTDFGFKKLFGQEPNKDLLLDFLNELLKGQRETITNLSYKKNEHLDDFPGSQKGSIDLYCETEDGNKFAVQIQNNRQEYFKDKALFDATFPIRDQYQYEESDVSGTWDYHHYPIYVVSIINNKLNPNKTDSTPRPSRAFRRDAMFMNKATHEIFDDRLTLIFLEMPLFNKTIDELESRFDKWLYVLKNLHRLDYVPDALRDKTFEKLFAIAEIAHLTKEERFRYEDNLKNTR